MTVNLQRGACVALLLACLLRPGEGAPPAFVATASALLDAPRLLPLVFPSASAAQTRTLVFDSLKEGAVFARPDGALKTGIPYAVVLDGGSSWLYNSSGSGVGGGDGLVLCFTVQHMGGRRRSCSPPAPTSQEPLGPP